MLVVAVFLSSAIQYPAQVTAQLKQPPTSKPAQGSAGQRVSYFQGGAIYWNSGSGKVTVTYN